MSIELEDVTVLDNPAPFTANFKFRITFNCIAPGIKEELEWKLVYVGSAKDEKYDQELDSILVGPVRVGKNRFIFEAPPPDHTKIPASDLCSITVILLTCSYKNETFIRIGYYVNNEYNNDQAQIHSNITRNILSAKPKVTHIKINWDNDTDTKQDIDVDMEQDHDQDLNDDDFMFIPDIKIKRVSNGIISINISNISTDFWNNNPFSHSYQDIFQLKYRKVATKTGSHSDIDNTWDTCTISSGRISDNGDMFIKVPLYLNEYNLEFSLKTMNMNTNKWMLSSKIMSVHISSYLTADFVQYNNSEDITTHVSQLTIDVQQKYVSNLINDDDIHQNLLIKRYDNKSIDIYYEIGECLSLIVTENCNDLYGENDSIIYLESMRHFLTKNIFDFLFESQFEYKVNCLINDDGYLNFGNIRQKDIRDTCVMWKEQIGNVEYDGVDTFEYAYNCDGCGYQLFCWDYSYSCDVKCIDSDRHDFCLNCVNTVIRLNHELNYLLQNLLQNILIKNCIQCIVGYVIGDVSYKEFDIKDCYDIIDDNRSNRKRKLHEIDEIDNNYTAPHPKRRKLTINVKNT